MTAYFDVQCVDDLDLFARDVGPIEALRQDVYHWLITDKQSLVQDPEWGFGVERFIGKPIPSTFARDVENGVREAFADRISDARCELVPVAGELDAYRMDLTCEVDGTFLRLALSLSPSGARMV